MITFTCKGKGCSPRQWEGSLEILQKGNPCEAELCARGSRFHLIVGKHSYGNYLCIPDWDIGTELSSLQIATFCGQQGRISRTVRAILSGQFEGTAGLGYPGPANQY